MNLLLGLWNAGELIVLSLYFQQVLHDSPLVTGLAIAPQGVVGFTAGAFGARLARRVGVSRVLILTSAVRHGRLPGADPASGQRLQPAARAR